MNVFPCRDCGHHVAWRTSKAGNRYLGQPLDWHGDSRDLTFWPAHRCVPNPTWREAKAAADAERIAQAQRDGQIIQGVTVQVVKGRKVPIGTVAEVAWVGESNYGMRVALLIDGERVYTALTNVQTTNNN